MGERMKKDAYEKVIEDLFRIVNRIFLSVIRVDLESDTAYILQSVWKPEYLSKGMKWSKYLKKCERVVSGIETECLMSSALLEAYHSGITRFEKDISYVPTDSHSLEWMKLEVHLEEEGDKVYAIITARKTTREHLQKSIVERYVYQKCDCFIYLDAKNNSYMMLFEENKETASRPPMQCEDYSAEVIKYVKKYVVPEEQNKVISKMEIANILQNLEHKKTYSFSFGVMDPMCGYTRKLLEYQYYDKETQMILLCRTDITDVYLEAQENHRELSAALRRASTDSLTGVYNHKGMIDEVTKFLKHHTSRSALMFIDMDDFKEINDTLGHIEGDHLLCRTAEILRKGIRATDLVGRVGGDEFLICLKNIESREEVSACAQRICDRIRHLSIEIGFPISCSMGVAVSPDDGTDYVTLTDKADERLYKAKAKGKNQICMS